MQRRAPSSSKSGVPTTGGSVRGNVVAGLSWVKVRRKANIFGGNLAVEGVMVRGGRVISVFRGLLAGIEKMGREWVEVGYLFLGVFWGAYGGMLD